MYTDSLEKSLKTRHITMIAIGGSLGTGVFLTLGYSLSVGGIGGAIGAYIIMALVVYFLMTSLGEMSVFAPSSGSLCEYSRIYVGESFGFAMNINYWFNWVTCLALEISAAALIMSYWCPHISTNFFAILFFIILLVLNLFSVKLYGELEYWLSFIKIGVVVAFLILGFFVIIREPQFGIGKWFIQDSPFHQGLYGFLSVFALAGFSFQGTELIGVAVGETKNPENTLPTSIKLIFWRLTIFYILSLIVISLLIPFNSSLLLNGEHVKTSPFTIVFNQFAGIYAADAVNCTVLIALLSAANASLYSASRVLWNFAVQNKALSQFAKVHKSGVPVISVLITWIAALLAFSIAVICGENVFNFLTQITAIAGFIAWFGISLSHYRFRSIYLQTHNNLNGLKYKAKFFPYAQIFSMVMVIAIIALQVLLTPHFSIISTLFCYSAVIIFISCYWFHKYFLTSSW
jgi:lysine-specific permease